MRPARHLAVAVAVALASACGTTSTPKPDYEGVAAELTRAVVLPSYRDLAARATELTAAAAALRDDPSVTSLAGAQAGWRAARKAVRRVDAFAFGPTRDFAARLEYAPANGTAIDALVAGEEPLSRATLEARGANVRGLLALEHLLFDEAGDATNALAALTGEGVAARRRAYVVACAEAFEAAARELAAAWEPGGGGFATDLATGGAGSRVYPTPKAAVDDLVNQMIYATESVVRTRYGRPLGKGSGGTPDATLVEAARSDATLDDAAETLASVAGVYTGAYAAGDERGIGDLVRGRNAAADDRTNAALRAATDATRAVSPPFRVALTTRTASVEAAYEAANGLKRALASDVATALATTLKLGDADGD